MSYKRRDILKIKEIKAKSLLRKHKKVDSWFISRYGLNLYRGCEHDCAYCDGRAEKYQVDGDFANEIAVKINAPELIARELDPKRRRKPLIKGFILPGGGVGDSYQSIEKQYGLTRKVLEIMHNREFPVHLLTKSTLIDRDIDIISKINEKTKALMSFSFSSASDELSAIFEPGVPLPTERFELIKKLKANGLNAGIFLMPVIPFLTDTNDMFEMFLDKATNAGADYIIFGGMTLKPGRQEEHFYSIINKYFPGLKSRYDDVYYGDKWGNATSEYYYEMHNRYNEIFSHYNIPSRIPVRLYNNVIDSDDLIIVILEHIDYILKNRRQKSNFGKTAWQISNSGLSVNEYLKNNMLGNVDKQIIEVIEDINQNGISNYYEYLLDTLKF